MARALSDDLLMRVLKASTNGLSARQAAARFGVGVSTASGASTSPFRLPGLDKPGCLQMP